MLVVSGPRLVELLKEGKALVGAGAGVRGVCIAGILRDSVGFDTRLSAVPSVFSKATTCAFRILKEPGVYNIYLRSRCLLPPILPNFAKKFL